MVGVNPVLHADQIPAGFPNRERLFAPGFLEQNGPWLEEGNTVIVAPNGTVLAGPVREREETLVADLDLSPSPSSAATWIPPVTTTAPTSSVCTWTPRPAPRSSRRRTHP